MNPQPIHLSQDQAHVVYMLAWLSFAAAHSWLAGAGMRARFHTWFGAHARLIYNLVAVAHLGLVFILGNWVFDGMPRFAIVGWGWTALTLLAVGGWAGMFLVLRTYDLGRFSGMAQIRAARAGTTLDDDEPLITHGFHAYMRHPLYAAAFLILWGAAWNDLGLASAVWGTGYLIIGSRFEERRLRRLHGDAYRDYRKRVPAFIPWRGRVIK